MHEKYDRDVFEIMSTTRAMRRLKPEPVPEELLERLLHMATQGPSASNSQGTEFVMVTDQAMISNLTPLWQQCVDTFLASVGRHAPPGMSDTAYDRMVKSIRYQRDNFAQTPALVVPCYQSFPKASIRTFGAMLEHLGIARSVSLRGGNSLNWIAQASSVYPGVQNMLLAARALGLAANLTIWHLMLEREWKAVLGIPRDIRTFAVVPIGWPVGRFGPVSRRPVAEAVHRNGW